MRRTAIVLISVAVLLGLSVPARATTQAVAIADNFFNPATKSVNRGDKVMWTNGGFNGHTTTGNSPLNYWASTTLGHNATFTTPLALVAAGTYPYHCNIHFGMSGKIRVPLSLTKTARKITLTLASAAADATHKFVVQRKVGTSYSTIATVTTATYVFTAPSAGTYTFRTALQKNGTTATAAFFSLPVAITVT